MALNTKDILKYFQGQKMFMGVYAFDGLPPVLCRKLFGMIINLDKSYEPGSHWDSVFCPKFGVALYFDSFGNEPDDNTIVFWNEITKNMAGLRTEADYNAIFL